MELSKFLHPKVDYMTVIVGSTTFLGVAWLYRKWQYHSKYKLPKGPPQKFFSGNYDMFENDPQCHKTMMRLRDTYGDIVSIKMGMYDAILLNSWDTVQETMMEKGDLFMDRPYMIATQLVMGNQGILMSNGPVWSQLRRFTITALRDLGMGKPKMEAFIQSEAEILANSMDKHVNHLIDISDILSNSVSNVICSLIFNEHYEYDDDEFIYFIKRWDVLFQQGGVQSIRETFMPYLIPLFMLFKGRKSIKILGTLQDLKKFIMNKVEQHYESYDQNNIRDFVDMYIQFDKTSDADREGVAFNKGNLFVVIFDLFMAGTETSITTLKWAVLFLVSYPEIQTKCRDEIQRVIGNRPPVFSERTQLPYTLATIMEIQRMASIAALTMHENKCDVHLGEYYIPKGMMVINNLYAANMDSKYFPDPEKFNPQRWLDDEGSFHVPTSPVIFGGGPRVCLGETLAKYEIFLFLTSLIQQFEFSMEDPKNPPSLEGILGLTTGPSPYKVRVQRV